MAGSIEFTPPYQDGWQDNEEGATPITADILNNNYDAFLLLLNTWIGNIEEELVAVPDFQISSPSSGQVLKYNGSKWVNANESGGGGGSSVSWQQILQTGTKIGTITIDGISYDVYAPTPVTNFSGLSDVALSNPSNGQVIQYNSSTSKWENKTISVGDSVAFTQILSSGTKIGVITIDGTSYDIYAPSGGGGGGSSVSWNQVQLSGFKIAEVTIDGASQNVYIPNIPASTSDLNNDSNFVADASYVHTDNNYTTTEKNKLADLNQVEANPSSGTSAGNLNSIEIGGTKYDIPSGGGSGSEVEWTQITQSGTKIAEVTIDGNTTNVYAPTSGGGYTEVTGTLVAGETSVSLSDSSINNNSTFDGPYTTVFGVNPTNMVVTSGEQVLQEFVTQESELSGTVTVSSTFSSYPAWKAFLDSTAEGWVAEDSDTAPYLEYEFPSAVRVDEITWYTPGGIRESDLEKVQYSLDGTTWIDCTLSTNESNHVEIEDAETAQYWKMIFADGPYSQYMAPMVSKLQFISVGVGTLILTFPAQSENIGVKVRVS